MVFKFLNGFRIKKEKNVKDNQITDNKLVNNNIMKKAKNNDIKDSFNPTNSNNDKVNDSFNSTTTVINNANPLANEINDLDAQILWLKKDLIPKTSKLRHCELCFLNLNKCLTENNNKKAEIFKEYEKIINIDPDFLKEASRVGKVYLEDEFSVLQEAEMAYMQMIDVPLCDSHKLYEEEMHGKGKEIKLLTEQQKCKITLFKALTEWRAESNKKN